MKSEFAGPVIVRDISAYQQMAQPPPVGYQAPSLEERLEPTFEVATSAVKRSLVSPTRAFLSKSRAKVQHWRQNKSLYLVPAATIAGGVTGYMSCYTKSRLIRVPMAAVGAFIAVTLLYPGGMYHIFRSARRFTSGTAHLDSLV